MEKIKFNNESDFKEWTNTLNKNGELFYEVTYQGTCKPNIPTSYPCIAAWYEWDIRGTAHDGGCVAYVYPNDF